MSKKGVSIILKFIRALGRTGIDFLQDFGRSGVFLALTLFHMPKFRQSFPLLLRQMYSIGVLSLIIIVLSGIFIGMVVSLQGYNTLENFSAEQQLGQLLALSIVRELGPVVTALLFAGRAGTALTAEIGLMRTTEQIDSMEMMGVNPLIRIISPRLWAGLISLPLLSIIFSAVAILGGFWVGGHWLGVDSGAFWGNMQASVDFRVDVINGIIKSIAFGFVVTWVAIYQGYSTEPTSQGVSRATTSTVVYSSLVVLGLDFVLTAMMMGGW